MSETLLGYAAAAEFLQVPVGTVYALVSQKRIPHIRLGRRLVRFSEPTLRAWLEQRSIAPDTPAEPAARTAGRKATR